MRHRRVSGEKKALSFSLGLYNDTDEAVGGGGEERKKKKKKAAPANLR